MPRRAGRGRRLVSMSLLPGQPLDGSGIVCIHLFVRDEAGRFVEGAAMHPVLDDDGVPIKRKIRMGPARGRLACDPKKNPAPVLRGGVTHVTHRTEEPRAVTCPKCMASAEYKALTEALATKLGE